ncbi:MAG: hypothetical protein ACMVY4_19480 [Minwuia sp.]|uniref:hypothetical protein n=1 Tax=Minwuia sp. TaxID=2493630 RepID=UPI003A869485
MHRFLFPKLGVALLAVLALSACEIVDTGRSRIGGTNCGFSDAPPGTPEYRNCNQRNTGDPRQTTRTPGGSIF